MFVVQVFKHQISGLAGPETLVTLAVHVAVNDTNAFQAALRVGTDHEVQTD